MKIAVIDLLQDIDASTARMSLNNGHRRVLLQCGAAILELAQRAHGLEVQHLRETPPLLGDLNLSPEDFVAPV